MSILHDVYQMGQAIWLDYIRRSLLTSGKLQEYIDLGLKGMTSNPTIFQKAIGGDSEYEAQLRQLVKEDKSTDEIYDAVVLQDIGHAADILTPVYEGTNGRDGYVSLEVSPRLAYDTEGTIEEAKYLYQKLGRPNVMIKVPATDEGLPAITHLIGSGVNVNVTLIFSVDVYRRVAQAYIDGLKKLRRDGPSVTAGKTLQTIASVASFFVSRVDTKVDARLKGTDITHLAGKIGIANSKVAYKYFQDIFSGPDWSDLARVGATVQRPLWASTSTKNPDYPDIMYVNGLMGPDTVNTLPVDTLEALLDHGVVASELTRKVEEAEEMIRQLNSGGVDLDEVTTELQREGVKSFADSFDGLIETISKKREELK